MSQKSASVQSVADLRVTAGALGLRLYVRLVCEKPEKPKVCVYARDTKKTLSFFAPPEKQQLIYGLTFAAAAAVIFLSSRAAFLVKLPRAQRAPAANWTRF